MSQRSKCIFTWAAVALWAAFIFFMSAHTGPDLDEGAGLVAEIKRWLQGLATPLFGSDADIVSVAAHFCEYAVFGALLFAALLQSALVRRREGKGRLARRPEPTSVLMERGALDVASAKQGEPNYALPRRALWLMALAALALASLYGVSDEVHQLFVPGRMCDPADWVTDTLGAALGACLSCYRSSKSSIVQWSTKASL